MFGWFGQTREKATARELYDAAQAAARTPVFYAEYGVPDTIEGRFEMLALHLAVLLDRLGKAGEEARGLSPRLTEQFVIDMDDAMRDRGIGDLTVPKKVKKAAAALYDRHRAYGGAISAGNTAEIWRMALETQLAELSGGKAIDLTSLATYAAQLAPHLATQNDTELAAGRVTYPPSGQGAQPA